MNIGRIGVAAVLGLAAIGSGVGAAIAGQAAIGAWKRNYMANKPASFLLVAFAVFCVTQTFDYWNDGLPEEASTQPTAVGV